MAFSISPIPPPLKNIIADAIGIITQPWANFFSYLFNYTQIRWNDINIGGATLAKAASNQPDIIAIAGTSVITYALRGSSGIDELHGAFELQHDYQEGTDIYPHLHWYPDNTGAGNVILNLDYVVIQSTGNLTGTFAVTTAAPGVAWQSVFSEFGAITGTTLKIGAQIHLRLWRNASATGDTYASNIAIGTLGIHHQIDYPGSLQKTSK